MIAWIFGGGFILAFMKYLQSIRETSMKEVLQALEMYKAQAQELRDQTKAQEKRIHQLELEQQEERVRLAILEGLFHDIPLAQWVKDKEGRYVIVSQQFETQFLIPMKTKKEEVFGKTDTEIWGEEADPQTEINDQLTMATKESRWFIEGKNTKELDNRWKVLKWPWYKGREVWGTCGMAAFSLRDPNNPNPIPEIK